MIDPVADFAAAGPLMIEKEKKERNKEEKKET